MPAFVSPLQNPNAWAMTIEVIALPAAARYPGRRIRAVRCTTGSPLEVRSPALVIARALTGPAGSSLVELEPVPFPIRAVLEAMPFGLPTFYIELPGVTDLGLTTGDPLEGGEALRDVTEARIAVLCQDGTVLDPARWAADILAAISAGGADDSEWQPFHDRVAAETAVGPGRPAVLLDHTARPLREAAIELTLADGSGAGTYRVDLAAGDDGDLQLAIARANAAGSILIPSLWAGGASSAAVRLLPAGGEAPSYRWVRWEDGAVSADEVVLTPASRHAAVTDLHGWFAPQQVADSPFGPALPRFTPGNLVVPLINGPATFADLIDELTRVRDEGGGAHFAGWAFSHDFELRPRFPDDPDRVLTLEALVKELAEAGRPSRFLVTKLFQIEPDTQLDDEAILVLLTIFATVAMLNQAGVRAIETNLAGGIVGALLLIGTALFVVYVVRENGEPIEPSAAAREALDALTSVEASVEAIWSLLAAETSDNPLAGGVGEWFESLRRFGVYHQKLIVLNRNGKLVGYAGGIDVVPDRLDDRRHVAERPYHDVHVRVEGPATVDLARTFDQRWHHDATRPPAFELSEVSNQAAAGSDIVQIARTYFRTADTFRRLPFAPAGDFTLLETVLRAIGQAREYIYMEDQYLTPPAVYRDALIQAVASGRLERLLIVVPTATDQLFGDLERREFVAALRAADPGGVVRVGCPVRRITLPEPDQLAAAGKCVLLDQLPAVPSADERIFIGPKLRVPLPPFWIAVEGELMLAVDESIPAEFEELGRRYRVLRGSLLGIGTESRAHAEGAAATVVALSGIYVHAKLMIVDDVFVSVGSANLNRRGFFHDGELNVFTVPEGLRRDPANLARRLRIGLWAEHLDLPLSIAEPLLADPIRGMDLFDRSYFAGNRFVPLDFMPIEPVFNLPPGTNWVTFVLQLLLAGFAISDYEDLYNTVVDPTTGES